MTPTLNSNDRDRLQSGVGEAVTALANVLNVLKTTPRGSAGPTEAEFGAAIARVVSKLEALLAPAPAPDAPVAKATRPPMSARAVAARAAAIAASVRQAPVAKGRPYQFKPDVNASRRRASRSAVARRPA